MKYDFAIRIDVGAKTGSGHLFRCLAIMEELKSKDKTVIFLINDKEEFLKHFENKSPPHIEIGKDNCLEEIKNCKKYKKMFSKLIVDLPHQNERYSEKFQNICQVVILDDLGNKEIFSEIIINGSIVKKFHNYKINRKETKLFLDSNYMIIRPNILKYRDKYQIRNESIERILITFGGSDSSELTQKILNLVNFSKFNVSVLIGPSYRNYKKLEKIIQGKTNIQIITSTHDVAKLFINQDLVISASGITAYELALLGVPTIFIPSEKHEELTANEFAVRGFGLNYGFWDSKKCRLEDMILKMEDCKLRRKMYDAGRKNINGGGLELVVKKILNM
jgi:UDP-2,4-diacetamido-2,4,6-trideoxy-beta-L-altropyranose hydrolase